LHAAESVYIKTERNLFLYIVGVESVSHWREVEQWRT